MLLAHIFSEDVMIAKQRIKLTQQNVAASSSRENTQSPDVAGSLASNKPTPNSTLRGLWLWRIIRAEERPRAISQPGPCRVEDVARLLELAVRPRYPGFVSISGIWNHGRSYPVSPASHCFGKRGMWNVECGMWKVDVMMVLCVLDWTKILANGAARMRTFRGILALGGHYPVNAAILNFSPAAKGKEVFLNIRKPTRHNIPSSTKSKSILTRASNN